jgi:hypothetical protein
VHRLNGTGRGGARAGTLAACALAVLAALGPLGGCASRGPAPAGEDGGLRPAQDASAPADPAAVPQLRLAPAQLGRTLALQQHIDVRAPGHAQQLDVVLEADAAHVRLAVLAMGQVAARLDWDGTSLDETRAPWWPPQVSGARILSDLQFAEWPVASVRAALPAGWQVAEEGDVRTLRHGDEIVASATRRPGGIVEIAQRRVPYTLTIASQPLDPVSDAGAGSGHE